MFLDTDMTWKFLCRCIFLSNKLDPYLQNLICGSSELPRSEEFKNGKNPKTLENDNSFDFAVNIKLKPSRGCINLIGNNYLIGNDDKVFESSSSSSYDDSSEFLRAPSNYLQPNEDFSSKTNLLIAPSASTTSAAAKCPPEEINENVKKSETDDDFEIGFNRNDLVKRLQNLVKKSLKNYEGDVEVS